MRRRPRFWAWTLTLTAALLAVVWVGSGRWGVRAIWQPRYGCALGAGSIMFVRYDVVIRPREAALEHSFTHQWEIEWWFQYKRMGIFGPPNTSFWLVPLWPFVLLTGVPGVWMLVKTRKRTNPHACPACGYDRTGLPQTPTGPAPCPECGTKFAREVDAQ